MRGTSFANVALMVRGEVGGSLSTTLNPQMTTLLYQRIATKQQLLADQFDWPFLRGDWQVLAPANVRYLSLPAVNLNSAVNVTYVETDGRSVPVEYGINWECYNTYDSDAGVTAEPISRWQQYNGTPPVVGTVQFEIWPMPSIGGVLLFKGQRVLTTFVDGTTLLDLDDVLVALHVAADLLLEQRSPLAQLKLGEAAARFNQLKRNQMTECSTFGLASKTTPKRGELYVTHIGN